MPVAWCCLPSVNILYSIWIIIWKCYLWFIHSQPFMDLPIASLCNSRCVHKAPECVWVCSENFMLYSQWMCTIVLLLQFFSFFEYILYNFPFYSIPFTNWNERYEFYSNLNKYGNYENKYIHLFYFCVYIFSPKHTKNRHAWSVCAIPAPSITEIPSSLTFWEISSESSIIPIIPVVHNGGCWN